MATPPAYVPAAPVLPAPWPSVAASAPASMPASPAFSMPVPEGRPAGSPGVAPLPPPPAAAPTPATPPASEQALLSKALWTLRSRRHPSGALATLDEYAAKFPRGTLRPEATRLRTEALLALGEKRAALIELDRAPLDSMAGNEESRLVRGELRASAGRWSQALQDFEAVVRAHLAQERAANASGSARSRERFERALWGRASARSHLGDESGARADLRECLRRFPRGRFAPQASRLLGELR